jgi:CDGSH iron-sulfur domain-containing protein 1
MARIIKHEAKGPIRIEIGGEVKSICMCGLSKNKPFCDGSHKICSEEKEDKIYRYDEDGEMVEVDY